MSLDVVATALIMLAAFDWAVTMMLVIAARHVGEPALTERAATSVVLTFGATLGAILGMVVLADVTLPRGFGLSLIALAFAIISVPQVLWLVSWMNGKFR